MYQLEINQAFNVSVEKLYQAWSDAKIMSQWFAPGNMTVPHAHADMTIGGTYRIEMHDPDNGNKHIVGGEYITIESNAKLVFSWQWEGSPAKTKVTLMFKSTGETSSELQLIHTEFDNEEARDLHQKGWNGCISNLINYTTGDE